MSDMGQMRPVARPWAIGSSSPFADMRAVRINLIGRATSITGLIVERPATAVTAGSGNLK